MSDELAFAPALELAAQVRARKVSPVELTELYLDRIERLDPQLNAYVTVDAEGALAAARAAESSTVGCAVPRRPDRDQGSQRDRRPAHDVLDEGVRDQRAEVRCSGRPPDPEAGFVVLGKTNTPEFGTIAMTESELNGDCRNPWDVSRTPGGLERRRRGRDRSGALPGRARQRRRRLDPHPLVVLRALRDQAVARARLAGAVRIGLARARHVRPDRAHRARCGGAARRDGRLRDRRLLRRTRARAAVPRRG